MRFVSGAEVAVRSGHFCDKLSLNKEQAGSPCFFLEANCPRDTLF